MGRSLRGLGSVNDARMLQSSSVIAKGTLLAWRPLLMALSPVIIAGSCRFSGSAAVSLFPPPETGEGEGGGEGWWPDQAVLLPPISTLARLRRRRAVRPFLRQGEGVV